MFERYGITDRDWRNMAVVAIAIAILMAVLAEGDVVVRMLAGVLGGLISSAVFVVTTIIIKKVGLGQ